ncbi:ParB/RepB/Spo0J family partition protein [Oscillospiraceae bacterium 21-37]|uniref:ParB/RepB/Spo0J family partition protein n=1 Tax=Acutalibacter sp. JLR.KK004 TaxID=3112622 RepID=UPI002FEF38C9
MRNSAAKIQMTGFDDLFGPSAEPAGEQFQEIALAELHPFKGHPFHVTDDEKMREMAASVAQHGVLVPGIVRPKPEGGYELVSGHRRRRACELAGLDTMPVFVRELDDDEATLIMVDSNLQREKILPSEKAFAYKMKLEAMKRKAGRPGNANCGPVGHKSRDDLAEKSPDSARQIQRLIRLTCLHPALLQMVDNNKLVLRPAVELSYLTQEEQASLLEIMGKLAAVPTLEQAQRLKKYSQEGRLSPDVMDAVLGERRAAVSQVTLKKDCLKQYFPQSYTQKQMEDVIFSLLENWKSQQEEK